MSRVDDNFGVLEWMKNFKGKEGDYHTSVLLNLNIIASVLADISKSLAVVADAMEGKKNE